MRNRTVFGISRDVIGKIIIVCFFNFNFFGYSPNDIVCLSVKSSPESTVNINSYRSINDIFVPEIGIVSTYIKLVLEMVPALRQRRSKKAQVPGVDSYFRDSTGSGMRLVLLAAP
jgi:hypothetical protein